MTATVQSILSNAQEALAECSDSPRLDSEVLLGHVLGTNRAKIYANPDLPISKEQALEYQELVNGRVTGKPVSHLTGSREFWSMNLQVTPAVLVPRPETELLVEMALELLPAEEACTVLDLGTGTGAVAIAIGLERPEATVIATDRSTAALDVARKNLARHCPERVTLKEGNWYAAVKNQRFNIVVSNPPYVSTEETEQTDPELRFEPRHALYSGTDGLDDIRLLVDGAADHLEPGGWLLLEHGYDQAEAVTELLKHAGFIDIETRNDLSGHERVTGGRLA